MATTYTVIGLLLDIAGAWLIAYEILWGYPKRNQRLICENRLGFLKTDLSKLEQSIKNYPSPPYMDEDIARCLKELHESYDPMISEEQTKIKELSEGHIERSFSFAFLGIILLTLGFVLQLVGSLSK